VREREREREKQDGQNQHRLDSNVNIFIGRLLHFPWVPEFDFLVLYSSIPFKLQLSVGDGLIAYIIFLALLSEFYASRFVLHAHSFPSIFTIN
jgi:hypothetical protein